MPGIGDFSPIPNDFAGIVRLFPLPNLVMFPGVVQPLHIFEPRYIEMLEDALQGDRIIALALLKPGWESKYAARPAIAPVVCVGRVVTQTRDDQGRYNLLLLGGRRARIVLEKPPTRSFRTAEVELLEDCYTAGGAGKRPVLQRKLIDSFRQFVPQTSPAQEQIDQLLGSQIPLGMLTDIIAFTVGFDIEFKQKLLAECNVDRRAQLLLDQLARRLETDGDDDELQRIFPPPFSNN